MSDGLAWWLGGGDWYDLRQRREIEGLGAAVSDAYAQSSRLRSRLSEIEGNLTAKVDRIAAAFDAFVELSDIRAELMVYSKPAMVRHAVRELLGQLASGATVVPPDLPDVPGYWLVPATRALYAQLSDDDATAARHIEQATELDGPRTRYFLTAALRLAGPVDLSAVQLAGLLPHPGAPVTRSARAMWRATAAGAFGAPGSGVLVTALVNAIGRPDDDAATDDALVPAAADDAGSDGDGAPAEGTVDRLPAWLTAIGRTGDSAASVSTVLHSLTERLAPGDEPTEADPTAPLQEILAALVDEGHEPERALLRRAERLRSLVESGLPQVEYEPWDAPVGTVDELVRRDLFDGRPGPMRTVALRAAAPWLDRAVDTLVAELPAPPRARTARVRGHEITVTASGADPTVLDQLRAESEAAHRTRPTRLVVGAVLGGLGLLTAIIAGLASAVLVAVLGAVVLLVGAGVAYSGWRHRAESARFAAQDQAALERMIETQVESLRESVERDTRERAAVDRYRAELSELLAAPGAH